MFLAFALLVWYERLSYAIVFRELVGVVKDGEKMMRIEAVKLPRRLARVSRVQVKPR